MVDILVGKQATFSAAHYLPDHPKCGCIHGHTYFIRDLMVVTTQFVDLGDIKKTIGELDHMLIIPKDDAPVWNEIAKLYFERLKIRIRFVLVDGPPTVETIAKLLKAMLQHLPGVAKAEFELYEGPEWGYMTPNDPT